MSGRVGEDLITREGERMSGRVEDKSVTEIGCSFSPPPTLTPSPTHDAEDRLIIGAETVLCLPLSPSPSRPLEREWNHDGGLS